MNWDATVYEDTRTLYGKLRATCDEWWNAFVHHPFVKQLGAGTLHEECFRSYLMQDYLFLVHFARAYALAVYKSERLSQMKPLAATLSALLNVELELHIQYCSGWGISQSQMEAVPEAPANLAYTRYVLERGLSGDALDLQTALAPCVIGYAEIGVRLAESPDTRRAGNLYWDWIALYSGEEFQRLADGAILRLDQLAAERLTPVRFGELAKTFQQATLLEIGFWDMGLSLSA